MAKHLTREIVTLQFGHFANFVGTHLWNLQENSFCYDPKEVYFREINHDCLYRNGITLAGLETFTPRAVLFDLKGSLGALPQFSSLYDTGSIDTAVPWFNDTTVHRADPEPKNEFQMDIENEYLPQTSDGVSCLDTQNDFTLAPNKSKPCIPGEEESLNCSQQSKGNTSKSETEAEKFYDLDKDVAVWSDFLGTQFHPKTVQLIGGEFSHNAETFDVFGYGQNALRRTAFFDEVEESLHFFLEECDSLQGFQVITELANGFGGLASELLQDISDEFSSKSIMTFGVLPSRCNNTPVKTAHRILNTALSFHHLIKSSSLFAPLSLATEAWYKIGPPVVFPHLIYKPELQYHTSSILAASLDTVTLPFRLATQQTCRMSDLVDMVTTGGRTVANMSTAMPIPCGGTVTLNDLFNDKQRVNKTFLSAITPNLGRNSRMISNAAILRYNSSLPLGGSQSSAHQMNLSPRARSPRDFHNTAREVLTVYFQNLYPEGSHSCWSVGQACMTKSPFPNIFDTSVTQEGSVIEGYSRTSKLGVPQISVLSNLSTSTGIENVLNSLRSWSHKMNIQKYNSFLEAGTEFSTFEEALESISSLAQRYEIP